MSFSEIARGRVASWLLLGVVIVALCGAAGMAADKLPERPIPTRVELPGEDLADLQQLQRLEVNIDAVFDDWARLYLSQEEWDKLTALGFRLSALPDEGLIGLQRMRLEGAAVGAARSQRVPDQYHDYATLTADLATIAADHSDITRLSSIGQSVQGRELWMMKITANPDVEEAEPELVYISSMHGDEVVGKEMCFNFINYLTDGYGSDSRVTALVDSAEIWIMPSMNPDGTELGQRFNANGVDLNRDFPDQFIDAVNTTAGRQPETAAVMNWVLDRTPLMSMNMHGGALVVNYPYDSNPAGASVFSPAPQPDHDVFVSISRTYADNNPPLSVSNSHPAWDNGITNGADWYSVNGGMQDWNYVWHGGFEVLLEISNTKWPPASQLPAFWDDNLESMLSYFERSHDGVRGIVTDAETGLPARAEIRIDSNPNRTFSDPDVGDYHRMLLPGTYTLHVSGQGYETQSIPGVVVAAGAPTIVDVALEAQPPNLQPSSFRVEDGVGGNGFLDPGETADFAVTLRNLGRAATGVYAELEPTGWYAEATRPVASYPDIAMSSTAETEAPYHEVRVSPSVPAGHKLGFAVRWSSAEGSGTSEPIFLDVGEPACETVAASDLPQTVSYIATAVSQVQATSGTINEIRVTVDIRHNFIGDVQAVLSSPAGTSVVLHNNSGGSADDIVGTYGVDLTPAESLDAFIGQAAAGTWTLTVGDSVIVNNGSLEAWSLEVCGVPAEATTPEMRFRDLERTGGGALLEWWTYPGLSSYRVYRSTDPSSAAGFVDVTAEDGDTGDTVFFDTSTEALSYFLVTGVGQQGEGPKGHFGE